MSRPRCNHHLVPAVHCRLSASKCSDHEKSWRIGNIVGDILRTPRCGLGPLFCQIRDAARLRAKRMVLKIQCAGLTMIGERDSLFDPGVSTKSECRAVVAAVLELLQKGQA